MWKNNIFKIGDFVPASFTLTDTKTNLKKGIFLFLQCPV